MPACTPASQASHALRSMDSIGDAGLSRTFSALGLPVFGSAPGVYRTLVPSGGISPPHDLQSVGSTKSCDPSSCMTKPYLLLFFPILPESMPAGKAPQPALPPHMGPGPLLHGPAAAMPAGSLAAPPGLAAPPAGALAASTPSTAPSAPSACRARLRP